MSVGLKFRYAQRKDVSLILRFIKELAVYEKMLDEVIADEIMLEEWIFDRQKAEVIFAVAEGKEVGFALFFHNFSTFLGRAGLYLEDLFAFVFFSSRRFLRYKLGFIRLGWSRTLFRQLNALGWPVAFQMVM